MTITIITPTYNSAATVEHTIQSILEQSYSEIEYIVVDGGSTDGTQEIIQSYGDQIAHFISEPDKGLYDAMNKGIWLASGAVVGILNSDDFYHDRDVLKTVINTFQKKQVDSVYGDLQYVDPAETTKVTRHWESGPYKANNFLYGWMPPHPTFFVRRKLYEEFGMFDTSLSSSADYELMLRFLYRYKATSYYIPKVLVRMRAGGVSNASFRHRLRANREDRLAWEINDLQPKFFTTWMKPVRKIGQFKLFKSIENE